MGDFNTFNRRQYTDIDVYGGYVNNDFTKGNGKVYDFLIANGYYDITTTPPPVATNWNMTRVDFIFSSDPLVGSNSYIFYTDASDHLPVIVDIPYISNP